MIEDALTLLEITSTLHVGGALPISCTAWRVKSRGRISLGFNQYAEAKRSCTDGIWAVADQVKTRRVFYLQVGTLKLLVCFVA